VSVAAKRKVRLRRAAAVAVVCAVFAGATALAVARTVAGPAALRPVPGSGEFHFSGKTTAFGAPANVVGTATTKVIPAAIKPGEPARFVVDVTYTATDQAVPCPSGSGSGTVPGQTVADPRFPLTSIRPGHGGEDLFVGRVFDAPADATDRVNGQTWKCGPPNSVTRTGGYDARVPGSATAKYAPGCYAPFPSDGTPIVSYLDPNATFEGTFATLSVGGVDCTSSATAGPKTFTDSFSAVGQTKPHAVAVPLAKTRAEVTLRWTKPGDRFTIANVVLVPKRKTASVTQAAKLKITFGALTPTSLSIRIGNLTPGKLTFKIVSKRLNGTTTVRTRIILKT